MKRWTTGEVSKQRNVSIRTLRYYDQIHLLTPSFKEPNGRRYYSEDDLFTLEKILILKSLSLPLEDVRKLLNKLSYKQLLVSHYNYLQEKLSEIQTSISYTTALIHMMDLDESLSWERVTELVQHSDKNSKKWTDYFEEEDKVYLQEALPNLSIPDKKTKRYMALLKQIEWCITHHIPPESQAGAEIASELAALSNDTFQGNNELQDKFWEVRKKPAEETGLYPISEEVLEFVERCIACLTD